MAYYTGIDNLDHDPDLANALGNMVVAWANAETSLCMTLAGILNQPVNMVLFGYYRIPTFEARVKFILALLPEWGTKKYDKNAIAETISKINALASTRNHWVHNSWCTNKDKTETVLFDYRRQPDKGRRKPVNVNDVKQHVKAVRARTKELDDLIPEIKI